MRTLSLDEERVCISTAYPISAAPELRRFNREFDRQQRLWFDATVASMRAEQRAAVTDTAPFWYIVNSNYNQFHRSPTLISLHGVTYRNTDGAHGLSEFAHENYRLTAHGPEPFALADLFVPGSDWVARLSALCRAGLRAQHASSVVDGAITAFTADEMASFTVSPVGLSIWFPPYAFGSYAEGDFHVEIAWPELAGLLRHDGPAAEFLP